MPLVLKAVPRSGTPGQSGFSTIPDADAVRMRVIGNTIMNINEEIIDGTNLSAFQNAIAQKSITRAVEALPFDNLLSKVDALANPLHGTLIDGLVQAGHGLPTRVGFKPTFTKTDPRALQWAQEQSARLITNISTEQKEIIRSVIANAFSQQRTVDQTAQAVQSFIGLTRRQESTMLKFNRNNVNRFVSEGMTIGDAERKAMSLAQKYRDKLIKSRGRTIARTEIQMAQNNGRYLGFQQAVEQGYSATDSIKRWVVANAACPDCSPLRGYSVLWNQEFPNGFMMPPAHPNCRCTAVMLDPRDALVGLPPDFKPLGSIPIASAPVLSTPIPQIKTEVPEGFKTAETAIDESFANADKGSYFAYDSSGIEDFQIRTNKVFVNGVESTEFRFKLTAETKKRLQQIIETREKDKWRVDDRVIIDKLDRKNRNLTITHTDHPSIATRSMRGFPETNVTDDLTPWVYHGVAGQGFTFTKYMPDGTIIRFVLDTSDEKLSYAFDGAVRVFVNGKATRSQLDDILKELGVTNRYPTESDIDAYKRNRFLQLVDRRSEFSRTKMSDLEDRITILGKVHGDYKDMNFYQDDLGLIQLTTPPKLAKELEDLAPSFYRHSLQNRDHIITMLTNGGNRSTTERFFEGFNFKGISSDTDITTGGADYVFTTPIKSVKGDSFTIYYDAKKLHKKRADFFSYSQDSYGVRNPNFENNYSVGSPGDKDTIMNLKGIQSADNEYVSGETMFRQRLSNDDIDSIAIPTYNYPDFMNELKEAGITTIGGRPVKDVVKVQGKTYTSVEEFMEIAIREGWKVYIPS